jgi:riboflavin synthase
MFTGLVEACVPVRRLEFSGGGARLLLPEPAGFGAEHGDSIAVSGCCLTVAGFESGPGGRDLLFELSAETLARTAFGQLSAGSLVNLERAMQLGERLGGHLVSGHVDGVGRVLSATGDRQRGWDYTFELPPPLARYLIDKGSVTLDGISLTVVAPQGPRFQVAVIPVTYAATNLSQKRPGDPIHVEADLVGKWIERLMPPTPGGP